MDKRLLSIIFTILLLLSIAGSASATSILLSEGQNYYARYGDPSWGNMSAALDAATGNQVTVVSGFEDYSQMLGYDALWLDQRYHGSLTTNEINNITSFLTTGRKVVMIGENDNWNTWNIQLIETIAGGTYGGGFTAGYYAPIYSHEITQSVGTVYLASGSYVAVGGTAFFSYNFATLWGDNLLTVLDSNLFTDSYWGYGNNSTFATNIANWVADSNPIPEPATMLLFGSGLIGLAGVRRKFKK